MHFIIEKSKWLRCPKQDHQMKESGLLINGKMCCLGFCAKQLGVPDEELSKTYFPNAITLPIYKALLVGYFVNKSNKRNNKLSLRAADINDNHKTNDEVKIKQLTELFEANGHTIEFVK